VIVIGPWSILTADLLNMALLLMLGGIAIAIVRTRSLLTAVLLQSAYSLLIAALWMVLDAMDVAFTEAAVGAGISTVLFLAALVLTGREEDRGHKPVLPMIAVVATGAALLYATADMPAFGDPEAPVQTHTVPRYIEGSVTEHGIPNIVTNVLASYRGYDTMGETVVVFTAALAVTMILGGGAATLGRRRRHAERDDAEETDPSVQGQNEDARGGNRP
jgi:multicomponent Na+:H+ antiporter subunit B